MNRNQKIIHSCSSGTRVTLIHDSYFLALSQTLSICVVRGCENRQNHALRSGPIVGTARALLAGQGLEGRARPPSKAHYFVEETLLMDSVHTIRHLITHGRKLFVRLPTAAQTEQCSGLGFVSLIRHFWAVLFSSNGRHMRIIRDHT